jgi:hypothetical protein
MSRRWWHAVPVSRRQNGTSSANAKDTGVTRSESLARMGGHALLPPTAPPRGKEHAARGPCGTREQGPHLTTATRNPSRVTLLLQVQG